IYVVRDPVDRAVSQYRHSYILGDLDGDLNGFAGSHEYEHILDASRYAAQLDAYRALFPDDAILVLDFDELVRAPQAVMDRICAHIGVPAAPFSELGAQNDSRELSRIPAPVLRFAQSPLGRRIAGLVPRAGRDRVRRGLARGPARTPPEFPRELLARIGDELRPDAARFREMTGLPFAGWSV
ncbi:MAG: sulfotransferase, partial [Maritimibacter sp.]|nr:sulfotransferase [Maritimibacter sp.]